MRISCKTWTLSSKRTGKTLNGERYVKGWPVHRKTFAAAPHTLFQSQRLGQDRRPVFAERVRQVQASPTILSAAASWWRYGRLSEPRHTSCLTDTAGRDVTASRMR